MRNSKNTMAMVFVGLGVMLWSSHVQASITCSGTSTTADFSIRSGPGSLRSMSVQDQDGLGTCYANALSLALEANLGAPVSYQQLAVLYGVNRNAAGGRGNAVTARNDDGSLRNNFTEGGLSCDTFNIVKARTPNYLCSRDSVPLENLANPSGQAQVMNAMSEFYDRFNQLKASNPQEARLFSANLQSIYSHQQTQATERCNRMVSEVGSESAGQSALEGRLGSYCENQYDQYKSYLTAATQLRTRLAAIPNDDAHELDREQVSELLNHAEDGARIARQKIQAIGTILNDTNLDGNEDTPGASGEMVFNTCEVKPTIVSRIRSQYFPDVVRTFRNGDQLRDGAAMMGSGTTPGPLQIILSTPALFPTITNAA
ncbi:MAG: hypothetical protein AABY86_18415, partial [Bdellovibrionota bacterium]